MLLLPRYIVRNASLTTLFISLVLTMIIWLTQTLRLLDFVLNGGAPLKIFGALLFLTIPKFFEIILPISLALGTLYTLNKFSNDSELVVMQNSGLSPLRLAQGLLIFTAWAAFFIFILSGWLTPKANREMDRLRNVVKSEYSMGLLRPGIFNQVSDDTVVYIAQRTSLQDLKGVFIHMTPIGEPETTITAENGGLITQHGKPLVVVFDGMRQQFNPKTGMVETLKFERYSLDLSSLSTGLENIKADPNQNTVSELWRNGTDQNITPQLGKRVMAELHTRLSRPLLAAALSLIAMVPFLVGRFNRRGQAVRITWIMLAVLVTQALHLGASSMAITSGLGVILLYGIPLLVIALCTFVLLNDAEYYRTSSSIFAFKERLI